MLYIGILCACIGFYLHYWILFTLLKGELYGTYNISGRRRTRDS